MMVTEAGTDWQAIFGRSPGDDRVLISWDEMQAWFHDLGLRSDRLHVESIGPSTEGREMLLLAFSSGDTIGQIDASREARKALSDASLLRDPSLDHGHAAGTKPVVLITAGIHATEVGGVQLMPELAAHLATSQDDRLRRVLESCIILVVPTLNPDGMDLVHEWYMSTLGTGAEGTDPPALYHRYAGHDNNRDWYTHALIETRNVIDAIHRPWRPNVVLDLHQMGEHAPRYVLPPYIDPAEPHVHPLITSLASEVGSHIATAHYRNEHRGVASGVLFDAYSPTRAYQHYHGGVRILAEAASAHIATPSTVEQTLFSVRRGFDPRHAGLHNPLPWEGGTWRLRDIMQYHLTTIHALLGHVTMTADQWLQDQWSMLAHEARSEHGPVYVIPPVRQQIDPRATVELVRVLRRGDVVVDHVTHDSDQVRKDSLIVRPGQPFGSYARALLELTPYPTLPTSPYDVTSHCLPVHMGVEVTAVPADEPVSSRPLNECDVRPFPRPTASDADRSKWLAIDPRGHASIRVVAQALRNGADVRRLTRPHLDGGRLLQAGTWLIAGDHALQGLSQAHEEMFRSSLIEPVLQGTQRQLMPRVGVYVSHRSDAIDAGWLQLMLEQSGIPYRTVRDEHVRAGQLAELDVLIFAHQEPDALINGNSAEAAPLSVAGGIGSTGMGKLKEYARHGGTVIAIDGAASALAQPLGVRIRFPLSSLPADIYSCPGTVVQAIPDRHHPLLTGIEDPFPVMMEGKNAFGPVIPGAAGSFPASFASECTVISGWMRGEGHLAGLGAIIDERIESGRFIGFAFRPHYRTQMLASYTPFINAIMAPGQDDATGYSGQ